MADRVGQQIGNYRLVKLLGKGGFAEVYLGQHVHLASKQAAIKILHLLDVDARKFQKEAETTEQLVHPHIVRLLDFDLEQGTPFLVLDFAPGGSLQARHPKGSVVPLATVGTYLNELAPALQYAHDKHILHRDIKPDNMLIGRQGELLLSDFGIAVLTQTGHTTSSSAYHIGGTPFYMAPEAYRGRPEKASDQYALAVVVYEWLCGSVPFYEGDFIQLGYQHAHEPVPSLREKNPAIPPDVEQVVMTALAKDPRQRFGSVLVLVTALEQASQVKHIEPDRESVPVILVTETTAENQSQQPAAVARPILGKPLTKRPVIEVPENLPSQPHTLLPSSGKERIPQAREKSRQAERVQNDQAHQQVSKIEEERVRKSEQVRQRKPRQEPIPSHFPPFVETEIIAGPRLRFLHWNAPILLLILALIILGSFVGLYAAVHISSARTQASATADITTPAQATASAAANAYARFVATNGSMFGFDVQHSHANQSEQILNPATVGGLKKKWAFHTRNAIDSTPAVVGGMVYVGSEDGNLYALDVATGAMKWAFHTAGYIDSSPVVADGVVYIGSEDGNLYAFHLPGT